MNSTASSHYGSLDTVRPQSQPPPLPLSPPPKLLPLDQQQQKSSVTVAPIVAADDTAVFTTGKLVEDARATGQPTRSSQVSNEPQRQLNFAAAAASPTPPRPAIRQRQKQQQKQINDQLQQLKSVINQAANYESTSASLQFASLNANNKLKLGASKMTTSNIEPVERQPANHQEGQRQIVQAAAKSESETITSNGNSDDTTKSIELAKKQDAIGTSPTATTPTSVGSVVQQRNNLTKSGSLALPLTNADRPPPSAMPERPYPKKVLFIVALEFSERFSYYGLRTVLVLYFRSVLGFNDASSTVAFHLFAALCYLTPILGAILGDSVWGKFKTIFYLSIVYFLGELVLVISSVFWNLGAFSVSSTFIGLLMIGIGAGGIKPCVSALGGDQFLPSEDKRRQSFFSLFYGAINLGSLISMFVTPILRNDFQCVQRADCFPYAFSLSCLLMFVAIVVFLLAKDQYHLVALPEKNIIIAFCKCVWLALKRKCSGQTLPQIRANQQLTQSLTDNTSSSSLSASSDEDLRSVVIKQRNNNQNLLDHQASSKELTLVAKYEASPDLSTTIATNPGETRETISQKRGHESDISGGGSSSSSSGAKDSTSHWLYLASDQFDRKSIGEFKIVLGILLLFVPLPVYWCLYDQQSSLWTLQATRMDGRLFNTGFVIQPDQMSVANPLLLLTAIPIFELCFYPGLNRLNVLTTPIQRITTGGLLAALTFVLSAMIEARIQDYLPPAEPYQGQANLILVNGLSECSMITPTISYLVAKNNLLNDNSTAASAYTALNATTSDSNDDFNQSLNDQALTATTNGSQSFANLAEGQVSFSLIEPLSFKSFDVLSVARADSSANYKLKFKLADDHHQLQSNASTNDNKPGANNDSQNKPLHVECPFDPDLKHELNIGLLPDKSVKLLYVEQGNGKLAYRLFNESLSLPPPGKARVRLLYEFFGSSAQARKRDFYLVRLSSGRGKKTNQPTEQQLLFTNSTPIDYSPPWKQLKFDTLLRDGQVIISSHIDVNVLENGDRFVLRTSDNLIGLETNNNQQQNSFVLEPGTRNLILAHQKDASTFEIRRQLLQDNHYRISLLWQLAPYLLISISEVMFSITGLEFSYSMAPDNMKSVILAAWSLTTAFGNILTVAVESMHLFSNIAHDFFFYATIMALDMILFAVIGFYYKPHKTGSPTTRKLSGN